MQVMKVEEAVGCILCHDITAIIPGEFKGRAFSKGHIIAPEDVPQLLKMGKDHIYVWECSQGFVHEDEAGLRVAQAMMGKGITLTEAGEGKVNMVAQYNGMCVINEEVLFKVNSIEEIVVATRNNSRPVKIGDKIAGVRVVPLVIDEQKLAMAESVAGGKEAVSIAPFQQYTVGIITTGSEVYYGRIKDKFGPVVKEKVAKYGCKVIKHILVPDDANQIAKAVNELIAAGAQLILTTGGMSVDPDDVTPSGIKQAGAKIVTYGAPVLPGSMVLVAYLGKIPVLGLPGCVMYSSTTVFDLLLPLVLAEQSITRSLVVKLGMGGLCLECDVCQYPACSFGTGA